MKTIDLQNQETQQATGKIIWSMAKQIIIELLKNELVKNGEKENLP